MRHTISLWLGSVIGVSCALGCALSEQMTVQGVVPYNWPGDARAPVVVPLPAHLHDAHSLTAYVTVEGASEPQQALVQYEPPDPTAGTSARAWLLWTGCKDDRGKTITIRFEHGHTNAPSAFRFRHADPQLHLTSADGQPVLSYWHGAPEPGKRHPLTDYIHPIIGLDGETVTDVRPADHKHHRGVFWAWVRHERQGKDIGTWWIPKNIHCEPGTLDWTNGPVFARFSARHWLVHQPENSDTGERFIREDLVCRVFTPTATGRAIDVEIMLTALEEGVRIGGTTAAQKGYGGLTFRNAPADYVMLEADGKFLPADGVRHRARWADWSGMHKQPDGRPGTRRSGAAVLVHPSHPDLPPEWLLRYYGILNVAFPGLDMLEIPTDEPLRLRYRLWVHRGNASQGRVEAQYRTYSADWGWSRN